jgi:hypothetical protein
MTPTARVRAFRVPIVPLTGTIRAENGAAGR